MATGLKKKEKGLVRKTSSKGLVFRDEEKEKERQEHLKRLGYKGHEDEFTNRKTENAGSEAHNALHVHGPRTTVDNTTGRPAAISHGDELRTTSSAGSEAHSHLHGMNMGVLTGANSHVSDSSNRDTFERMRGGLTVKTPAPETNTRRSAETKQRILGRLEVGVTAGANTLRKNAGTVSSDSSRKTRDEIAGRLGLVRKTTESTEPVPGVGKSAISDETENDWRRQVIDDIHARTGIRPIGTQTRADQLLSRGAGPLASDFDERARNGFSTKTTASETAQREMTGQPPFRDMPYEERKAAWQQGKANLQAAKEKKMTNADRLLARGMGPIRADFDEYMAERSNALQEAGKTESTPAAREMTGKSPYREMGYEDWKEVWQKGQAERQAQQPQMTEREKLLARGMGPIRADFDEAMAGKVKELSDQRAQQIEDYKTFLREDDYMNDPYQENRDNALQLWQQELADLNRQAEEYAKTAEGRQSAGIYRAWTKTPQGKLKAMLAEGPNDDKKLAQINDFMASHQDIFGDLQYGNMMSLEQDMQDPTSRLNMIKDMQAPDKIPAELRIQIENANDKIAEIEAANNRWSGIVGYENGMYPGVDTAYHGEDTTPAGLAQYAVKKKDDHAYIYEEKNVDEVYRNTNRYDVGIETYAGFMTQQQRDVFRAYYNNGNKDAAWGYYQGLLDTYLYRQGTLYNEGKARERASEPVMGTVYGLASVADSLLNTPNELVSMGKALLGDTKAQNPYGPDWNKGNYYSALQDERARSMGYELEKHFGEAGKTAGEFIGKTGYSVLNNGINILASGGNPALASTIFSSRAASSRFREELGKNKSVAEAAILAFADAGIEYVTNRWISMEALLKPNVSEMMGDFTRQFGYWAKNVISEASEEASGSVLNLVTDKAVSALFGHQSDMEKEAAQLTKQKALDIALKNPGYTYEQVQKLAAAEACGEVARKWWNETAEEAIIGGISGGAFSGLNIGQTRLNNWRTGAQVRSNNTTKTGVKADTELLIQAGLSMPEGSASRATAEAARKKLEKNGKLSLQETGRLTQGILYEAGESIRNDAKGAATNVIAEALQARGVDQKTAQKLAEIDLKAYTQGIASLNKKEKAQLDNNFNAYEIYAAMVEPESERYEGVRSGETAKAALGAMEEATKTAGKAYGTAADVLTGQAAIKRMLTGSSRLNVRDTIKLASDTELRNAGQQTGAGNEVLVAGNLGTIEGFLKGKAIIRTAEGTKNVDLADIEGIRGSSEEAAVLAAFMRENPGVMSDEMAGKAVAALAVKGDEIGGTYADDVAKLNFAAHFGWDMPETAIGGEIARTLWEQAKKDAAAAEEKRVQPTRQVKQGKGVASWDGIVWGTKEWTEKAKSLSENRKRDAEIIGGMSKLSGLDIHFVYDTDNKGTGYWGDFDKGTGTITVNLAAEDDKIGENGEKKPWERSLLAAVSHEMTHWLEANSKNGWLNLKKFVLSTLTENGVNLAEKANDIIHNYNEYYKKHNIQGDDGGVRQMTLDEAVYEMVADSCDQLLTSEEMAKRLKATNEGLFGKIQEFVSNLVTKIKESIGRTRQSASYYSRNLGVQNIDEMARIWLGGYDEVIHGYAQEAEEQARAEVTTVDAAQMNQAYSEAMQKVKEKVWPANWQTKETTEQAEAAPEIAGEETTGRKLYYDGEGSEFVPVYPRNWGQPAGETAETAGNDLRFSLADKSVRNYLSSWSEWHLADNNDEMNKILRKYGISTSDLTQGALMAENRWSQYGITKGDQTKLDALMRDNAKWENYRIDAMGLDEEDLGAQYVAAWKNFDFDRMEEILMEKMVGTDGVIPYKAPHWYDTERHRQIANLIKEQNPEAMTIASIEMAQLVPKNAVLVPMPSRNGKAGADTTELANRIGALTGAPVVAALEGVERMSRKEAKDAGVKLTAEELGFRQVAELPEGKIPIFIDNVVGSGVTAQAAHDAIGKGITLAYAKSTRSAIEGLKNASSTYLDSQQRYLIPLEARMDMEKKGVSGTRFSIIGKDPATHRTVYMSNFAEGTDQNKKANHLIDLIQNIWSKKPVELTIYDNNSNGRKIEAQFDPDFDPTGARKTDAGKMAYGNRKGNHKERRVTLNLADDYREILEESNYLTSDKDNKGREDVKRWHYFIDDIYYVEQNGDEATPYRIEIDIKETKDGEYVYTFFAREQSKEQKKKLSVMGLKPVNTGVMSDESASASKNSLPQNAGNSKFSIHEMKKTYDSLNVDPLVYFKGTMEQIDAAEKSETERAEEFKKLIQRNEFMALEFEHPDGRREILHHSTRPGVEWQLSYIGSDGVPNMHESYGDIEGEDAGKENIHSMDELYQHFVRENLRSSLTFNVMEDDNVVSEKTIQKALENPEKRFSLRTPVEATKDLVAVHNMTEDEIMGTLEEEGFTAPSIAIIRAAMGHSKYGEISVVFRKETIDPSVNSKNKVYGHDAWTPTRGNAQIETKLNYKVLQKARDTIKGLLSEGKGQRWRDEAQNWINRWMYEDQTTETKEEMIRRAYNNDGMIVAYQVAQGKEIEDRYDLVKVHPELQETMTGMYNSFLDQLEKRGMTQEFMDDIESMNKNDILEKYKGIFKESGDRAARIVEIYENKPTVLNKNVYLSKLKQAKWYQEDGRVIKREKEYSAAETAEGIRDTLDKGKFDSWVSGLIDGALGKRGLYNGKDPYTYDGSRKSFEALHMDVTAENIVKAMYLNHEAKGGEAGGATGLMAKGSKEYKSISEIREDKGRLQLLDEEEYRKKINELDKKINQFTQDAKKLTDWNESIIQGFLIEAAGKYAATESEEAVRKSFKENGIRLTEETLNEAVDLIKDAREIPTGYFEAKPERVVGQDEIEVVIIPDNVETKLINELDKRGIPYETYDGTDEDRKRVLNKQSGAMFSIRDKTDTDVEQWMMSVSESSLQTEAERALLRNFKSLKIAISLDMERQREYTQKYKQLEKDENPSKDTLRKIEAYKIRVQNAAASQAAHEAQLEKIISSEGYAGMMYYQQRMMNDFVGTRSQDEVNAAVEQMETAAEALKGDIGRTVEELNQLAESRQVRQIRSMINGRTLDEAAARIRKDYNSRMNKQELMNELARIRIKFEAGQDITGDMEDLAGRVLENRKGSERNAGLEYLRGTTIRLGESALKEVYGSNSSMKEIRHMLAGSGVKVEKAKDGGSLDANWNELVSFVPALDHYNGYDTDNALDQAKAVAEFVMNAMEEQRTSGKNEFAGQMAEVIADLTENMMTVQTSLPTDPTVRKQFEDLHQYILDMAGKASEATRKIEALQRQAEALARSGKKVGTWSKSLKSDIAGALDYFNKTAKLAIDQAKKNKQDEIIQQLKDKHTQDIIKRNEEWRNLMERDRQARRTMEDNAATRRKMTTVVTRIAKLLSSPTNTKNIPEHMNGLARALLETFVNADLSDGGRKVTNIQKKGLYELERRLNAWNLRDGRYNPDEIANEVIRDRVNSDLDTIREAIKEWNGKYKGKNQLDMVKQMGETLEKMQEATSEIYGIIQAEREIALGDRRVAVEDQAEKVRYQANGKHTKEWTGKAGRALAATHKGIVYGNMTPEYFFRTIGNEGLSDLWEEYHRAENRNGLELAAAKERLAAIAEENGYAQWDTNKKYKIALENGSEVELTLGQMMSLWATWNREQMLGPEMSQHLEYGGFYAEQDLREGLLGKKAIEKKAHRVTAADMARIGDMLTDEQKNFVDDVVQFMSNDLSQLGNEASMQAYGIKLYKEKYYFPFQMWDGIRNRKSNDSGSAAGRDRAFHPSFSKSRMHGANNALVIGDFMQTVTDHAVGMINYATMGLANETMQKVLNYKATEGTYEGDLTKRNIRSILEEAYGQEAMQYLRELQDQLNGGAVATRKSLGDKAISLFRKNAVAGSLSVAAQQPLSYIRAAMMINPKYLAAGLNPATWKGSHKEMTEHSGVAVIKDMGRFDMNFGQSARDYIMPDGQESTGRKIWNGITNTATILPELMDRMTWTRMWAAVKAEQHAIHPELDMKSDAFLDMCGERFNDLMRRTQVYDSVLVKSANMRSDNYFVKGLTSFMAEPTLTANVLADAVRQAKNGEKGGAGAVAKAGATFMLSAVLQAVVKGLAGAGRNPDENKTFLENVLYRFGNALLSEINPFSLIPGYSDLVSLIKDQELADDAMGAAGKMFKAGKTGIDLLLGNVSKKGPYRDIEDGAAQLAQLFTNLPAKNIMRDARMMYNFFTQPYAERETSEAVLKYQHIDQFWNADSMIGAVNKLLGDAGYETSNTAYYKRIYEAKKEGREQDAADMIEYLLKGKGVKQSYLESKVRGEAKKDESTNAAETAEFLLDEGGDPAEYIRQQLKAGNMSAEEARKLLKERDPEHDEVAAWWTVDRIEYSMETGKDAGSGKYYRLWDAMDANSVDAIDQAVKTMIAHGMVAKNMKKQIGTHYKQAYLEANNKEKVNIRNAMQVAYRKLGYTAADADETIKKWK